MSGSSSEDVLFIGEVPHDALFASAALVVHHGGAGTSHAACRAGVPSVVIPHLGDQHYWAQRPCALGVWSTCTQVVELCRAWLLFTDYLLQDSTLPLRDREFLIMRIGWLNGGAYEWAAHTGVARRAGITDE